MTEPNFSTLHHTEICVGDEKPVLQLLRTGFNFALSYVRFLPRVSQWVLTSGSSTFIITKRNTQYENINLCNIGSQFVSEHSNNLDHNKYAYPVLFCCSNLENHSIDRVFNVALEVKNVDSVTMKIKSKGGNILVDPFTITAVEGTVRISVIKSICENVIHTLVDRTCYNGNFLPGFERVNHINNCGTNININKFSDKSAISHCDHVTFVCTPGESRGIIKWYETCFNMRRFFTNNLETVDDGFVLGGPIGLRLKALHYWRCAESGVRSCIDANSPDELRIVIAEPLPDSENSHVSHFLMENSGPGVQHIGLSCENIVDVVRAMKNRGVKFRMPPPTYYEECGDLSAMVEDGVADDVQELRSSGILIDIEDDSIVPCDSEYSNRYLMQIFTYPIFSKDTFFMEVIQRCGATGFGSGNITALARSIIKYQKDMNNKID